MNRNKESLIAILLLVFCAGSFFLGFKAPENKSSEEQSTENFISNLSQDRVAVIALEGMIFDSIQTQSSPFMGKSLDASQAKSELKKALKNDKVKAVLMRVNSPGGTVPASQDLYRLINELKEKSKPVVVSMGDVCASGCYYLASTADSIYAARGTLTGSIGVIMQGLNFNGLLAKLGIQNQTFTAGKYKDLGSSLRPMSPEEEKIIQALLDDSYQQFLNDVSKGRGIDYQELKAKAEGLIYTGQQALEAGLVDEIGNYDDAKEKVKELLTTKGYENAATIHFSETWKEKQFDQFTNIFDIAFETSLDKLGLANLFGSLSAEKSKNSISASKYQPLWLLP